MGDGVLVYFGYPQAHEDDAERAARAGLELIQIISAAAGKTHFVPHADGYSRSRRLLNRSR